MKEEEGKQIELEAEAEEKGQETWIYKQPGNILSACSCDVGYDASGVSATGRGNYNTHSTHADKGLFNLLMQVKIVKPDFRMNEPKIGREREGLGKGGRGQEGGGKRKVRKN